LQQAVQQLEAAGGKVVVNSTAMPISGPPQAVQAFHATFAAPAAQPPTTMGNFVTMLDPDGNYLGLMQLDESMQPHFNAQPAQRTLSTAQVSKIDQWKQQGEPLIK